MNFHKHQIATKLGGEGNRLHVGSSASILFFINFPGYEFGIRLASYDLG
jgi:hypothetical protein